jgi:hypothetical protein
VLAGGCGGGAAGGGGASGSGVYGESRLPKVEATPDILELERTMFERLNADRGKSGLPPLAYDEALADIARFHAKDMSDHKFFAHDSPTSGSLEDRLDKAGYLALTARENLGEGPDVGRTQDSLLASPGHHANIMADDITRIGIGIVRGGVADPTNLIATQVFATPATVAEPGSSRELVLERIQAARKERGLPPAKEHPLLMELAEANVDSIPDDLSGSDAARIGQEVAKRLANEKGHGLKGVSVGTVLFIAVELFEPGAAVLAPGVKALGIATAAAKDERGRPAVKVLLLVGR